MPPASEQKERLWTFRWLEQIHKYATRRLKMKVWDLAVRRSIWRMVRNNSIPELASEPLLISIAREFDQSLDDGNGDFLRDVADASDKYAIRDGAHKPSPKASSQHAGKARKRLRR